MIKIREAAARKIPRPFRFPWGVGNVVEEVSIRCSVDGESWDPTIQLLEYEDGRQQVRFCVYDGNRFRRMPLIMGTEEIDALSQRVKRSTNIRNLLVRLTRSNPRGA